MTKILISGYYGFDNAGDDAVLYGIISSLKELNPELQLSVLSNQPTETTTLFQIPAYNRWNIIEIMQQIYKSDLVLLGGGTLLQDRTSPRSPLYYLGITLLAKMFRKPVFFYGQGFGPIVHPFSKKMVRWVVNKVDTITVRDEGSGQEMEAYGVTKAPIHIAADPALTIKPEEIDRQEAEDILRSYNLDLEKPIAFVAIRDWKDEQQFKHQLAISCDYLREKGWQVVFIAMQNPNDLSPSLDTIQFMEHKATLVDRPLNFKQIMSMLAFGDLVIGIRLHAIILAAIVNVPFIAISYDPKIDRFVESLGGTISGHITNLSSETLTADIEQLLPNIDQEKDELQQKIKPIIEKAFSSAELVFEILDKHKK